MKIAFLTPNYIKSGGIERVVSILANYLVKNKIDISIIAYQSELDKPPYYPLDPEIKLFDIFYEKISMKRGILKGTNILRKHIKEEKYDILISCGSLNFPLGVLATRLNDTKLICWEHSHYKMNNQIAFQKYTRKYWVDFANKIVTLTNQDRLEYQKNIYSKNKACNIPNPLDPLVLAHLDLSESKASQIKMKIISVGRLTKGKNFTDILFAAQIVMEKNPNWEWHIYGEGPEYHILQKMIQEKNLTKYVYLKGNIPNIYEVYREYDFLVSTSLNEGFGLVLIEALANRLPVLSYDVECGPKEIIENDINGYLIECGNYEKLADKICFLIQNEERMKKLSRNVDEVIMKYNIKNIAEKWIIIFEELVNGK